MKKSKFITVLLILSTILLSGCFTQQQPPTGTRPASPPLDFVEAILAEIEFPSPVIKDNSDVADFYDIEIDGEVDLASFVLCGSGAYPDEIAVFFFDSDEKANIALSALNKRLEEQIALFTTYTPDEMYKLEGAIIMDRSGYVFYLATADNSKAKEIVENILDDLII